MRMAKKVSSEQTAEKVKERLRGKVDLQLGKRGLTDGFINEVKNRLEKNQVVKIRVLRSYRKTYSSDIEEIAKQIADETGAKIYEVRGFTIILIKEK